MVQPNKKRPGKIRVATGAKRKKNGIKRWRDKKEGGKKRKEQKRNRTEKQMEEGGKHERRRLKESVVE
jgi:hypothetical protein